MEKIKFISSEQELSLEDIQEFENEFQVKLPIELKELLLKYNGGVFDGEMQDYAFGLLMPIKYGINTLEESIDTLQITEEHIPKEEIPFADDQGGNVFTISTKEEDYGKIYYWEMDVGEPRRNFVANSLNDFFENQVVRE